MTLTGRTVHPGAGRGRLLALEAPLSFWGGTDEAGRIVDAHHPQHGTVLAGQVVLLPAVRGSSSSSSVLAEQIRSGTAPAALVLTEPDAILLLGAWVAAELYGRSVPIVVLARPDLARLRAVRGAVTVRAEPGTATVTL